MTYRRALVYGVAFGVASALSTAASDSVTLASAAPYGAGVAVLVALAGAAGSAYRNGQPPRR